MDSCSVVAADHETCEPIIILRRSLILPYKEKATSLSLFQFWSMRTLDTIAPTIELSLAPFGIYRVLFAGIRLPQNLGTGSYEH